MQVRYILYKKGVEDAVDIVSPAALGGLKSARYAAYNPFGLMPMLLLPDGSALYESEVCVRVCASVTAHPHGSA